MPKSERLRMYRRGMLVKEPQTESGQPAAIRVILARGPVSTLEGLPFRLPDRDAAQGRSACYIYQAFLLQQQWRHNGNYRRTGPSNLTPDLLCLERQQETRRTTLY
jgi:hypothetical protein